METSRASSATSCSTISLETHVLASVSPLHRHILTCRQTTTTHMLPHDEYENDDIPDVPIVPWRDMASAREMEGWVNKAKRWSKWIKTDDGYVPPRLIIS